MKKIASTLFRFILFMMVSGLEAQNYIHGDFSCWNSCYQQFSNSVDKSQLKEFTNKKQGRYYFRVNHSFNDYTVVSGADTLIKEGFAYSLLRASSGSMYIQMPSDTHHIYIKTPSATGAQLVYFILSDSVVDIHSVKRNPHWIYPNNQVEVVASTMKKVPDGQGIYLRYSSDGWKSSFINEMTWDSISGQYKANIPDSVNLPNHNISYYCFTSGKGLSITHDQADWFSLSLSNNQGDNYGYKVLSRPLAKYADTIRFSNAPSIDTLNYTYVFNVGTYRSNELTIKPNHKSAKFQYASNYNNGLIQGGAVGFTAPDTAFQSFSVEFKHPVALRSFSIAETDSFTQGKWVARVINGQGTPMKWTGTDFYALNQNGNANSGDIILSDWSNISSFSISWDASVEALDSFGFMPLLDNLVYEDIGFEVPQDQIICLGKSDSLLLPYTFYHNLNDTVSIWFESTDTNILDNSRLQRYNRTVSSQGISGDTLEISRIQRSGTTQIKMYAERNNDTLISSFTIEINAPAIGDTLVRDACNAFKWNDSIYTQSGFYSVGLQSFKGCDSTAYLWLTLQNNESRWFDTVCGGKSWNGVFYGKSGTYIDTFINSRGCDSVVQWNLTVLPQLVKKIPVQACASYTWNGKVLNVSGVYSDTFLSVLGCDSIVHLDLSIKPTLNTYDTVFACQNYLWHGTLLTQSGIYRDTFKSQGGCDSISELSLTIGTGVMIQQFQTSCISYQWNGQELTKSGEYTDTFIGFNGCDSVVKLTLTIVSPSYVTEQRDVCNPISWNGRLLTMSGTYRDTAKNYLGCDSITELRLNITQINNQISLNNNVLTAVSSEGSYQWLDCDSAFRPILGANNQSFTPEVNGSFAVEITDNGCRDTSICEVISGLFRNNLTLTDVLYPNPTRDVLHLTLMHHNHLKERVNIQIINALGSVIRNVIVDNQTDVRVDLREVPDGLYTVTVTYESGLNLHYHIQKINY